MSDPVTRLNSALEGHYAIERELGEGGMATVYLADDLKHGRKVALKVLKPELAAAVGAHREDDEDAVRKALDGTSCEVQTCTTTNNTVGELSPEELSVAGRLGRTRDILRKEFQ